jgi:transposase
VAIHKYNQQFKDDVLAFWAGHPEMTVAQICKDFGISEATIYAWRKSVREHSGANPSGERASGIPMEEHRRLQKRNQELEQENYILKRAAAYFAKDTLPKENTLSS